MKINFIKNIILSFAMWKWKCCNCQTVNSLDNDRCSYPPCGKYKCSNCKEVQGW